MCSKICGLIYTIYKLLLSHWGGGGERQPHDALLELCMTARRQLYEGYEELGKQTKITDPSSEWFLIICVVRLGNCCGKTPSK